MRRRALPTPAVIRERVVERNGMRRSPVRLPEATHAFFDVKRKARTIMVASATR